MIVESTKAQAFAGKVIIITGASGNLGRACKEMLANQGARLALFDRPRNGGSTSAVTSSEDRLSVAVNLSDEADSLRAVDEVMRAYGRIDGLVHTVGGFRGGTTVSDTPLADLDFLLSINVRSTFTITKVVTPRMIAARGGRIVTVAARPAFAGTQGLAAYSASKAAVLRITESLSAELRPHGITANCIIPGTIDTPQNRTANPDSDHSGWVTPQSIAGVIAFLLSPQAAGISGAAIPVQGGG